ncbi:MAG: DUF3795 domain-containing protein [Anaerolineaceae bacterium]
MKMPEEISPLHLAPCGINCLVCYVHLRKKKTCPGCRGEDLAKPGHCRQCKIKDCAAGQGFDFCHQCPTFPCAIIKRLDRSYRLRYQVSLIESTLRHRKTGAAQFLLEEMEIWKCVQCGGLVSLHDRVCSECGAVPS